MGFIAIEAWGKRAFEQFPFIKHSAKRAYHLVSYALSSEKFKPEGEVIRITPNDGYDMQQRRIVQMLGKMRLSVTFLCAFIWQQGIILAI